MREAVTPVPGGTSWKDPASTDSTKTSMSSFAGEQFMAVAVIVTGCCAHTGLDAVALSVTHGAPGQSLAQVRGAQSGALSQARDTMLLPVASTSHDRMQVSL